MCAWICWCTLEKDIDMTRPQIVATVLVWETPSFETFEQFSLLWAGYVDLRLSNQWDCGWYHQLCGGCLLPEARNRAIKRAFEERSDFTHLLFIDSDVTGLYANDVKRMVEWDVPIVMPLVPLPVPGGVGPMTIAMLLSNTVTAAENIGC